MLPVFSVDFDIVSRARQQPLNSRMWLLHMPNRLLCQSNLRTADISQRSCCFCFPTLPRNQSHRTWRRAKRWHHNQHTEGKHYQPQYNFRSVAHVFTSILTMFCFFPQVRIKLLLLSAEMHLLRLTPILHMKQHFFLHRTGQPTRIALLYLRIRYGSASTTKIIKTIVIFSSLIKPVVM